MRKYIIKILTIEEYTKLELDLSSKVVYIAYEGFECISVFNQELQIDVLNMQGADAQALLNRQALTHE